VKKIDGVPESITRAEYVGLIESIGLDPLLTRSLEFSHDGIYAQVTERDDDGKPVLDGYDLAIHKVFIRVKD
jgi:hypothetical protein